MDNEEIASRFVDEILEKFPLIASQPCMGVERPDIAHDARAFIFRAYLILYRIEATGVEFVRVVHGAQKLKDLF